MSGRTAVLFGVALLAAIGGLAWTGCDRNVGDGRGEDPAGGRGANDPPSRAPSGGAPLDPELKRLVDLYPLRTCVVMEGHLRGTQTVNYMHQGRLVRFCCRECIPRFQRAPERYMALLDSVR